MTNTTKQSIISSGTTFHIFDESVQLHHRMPRGTYNILFNPMSGYSIQKVDDMTLPAEKMYGKGQKRIDAILKGFGAMNRSYGVLASGPGGMGKTMLTRSVAVQASEQYDLPIFVIDRPSPGLAQYIGKLGPAIVVFDEFEKIFTRDEEEDTQVQFLSLFDGLGVHKQMYLATVNDLNRINSYMVNRTGRFHKHLRFDYPEPDDIREYLRDHGVSEDQIEKVVAFSMRVELNYDHLRAIAFELTVVGGDFSEAVSDLNIKRVMMPYYNLTAVFEKTRLKTTERLDVFSEDDVSSWFETRNISLLLRFNLGEIVDDPTNGKMSIPGDCVLGYNPHDEDEDERDEDLGKLLEVVISPMSTKSIDF